MPFTSAADVTEKVRVARERLLTQGNPLGIVNRGEREIPTTLPTHEREGKAAHGFAEVVLRSETGRYSTTKRERSPIEVHQKSLTEEEIHIASVFVADAEVVARMTGAATAAYDGMPRGAPGPRSGGVPAKYSEAYRRYDLIMGKTGAVPNIHPYYQWVADWLVREVRHEATGRTRSVAEVGAHFTGLKHEATCRGVGIGMLKATLWRIGEIYRREMQR